MAYKLNPEFFYTSKGSVLQLINIAKDDHLLYRLTDSCRDVFEALAKGEEEAETLRQLQAKHPERTSAEIKEFYQAFIADLLKVGAIE